MCALLRNYLDIACFETEVVIKAEFRAGFGKTTSSSSCFEPFTFLLFDLFMFMKIMPINRIYTSSAIIGIATVYRLCKMKAVINLKTPSLTLCTNINIATCVMVNCLDCC